MFDIVMLQHSFPTLSMLNKMIAEDWMMQKNYHGVLKNNTP